MKKMAILSIVLFLLSSCAQNQINNSNKSTNSLSQQGFASYICDVKWYQIGSHSLCAKTGYINQVRIYDSRQNGNMSFTNISRGISQVCGPFPVGSSINYYCPNPWPGEEVKIMFWIDGPAGKWIAYTVYE